MTLTTQATEQTFVGDGVNKGFPYEFKIPYAQAAWLYSVVGDVETLIPSSQYSLSGLNQDTGGVLTYPLTGPALANGSLIKLKRLVPYTQELDIKNQTGFLPEVVETALDYLAMQIQQIIGIDAAAAGGDLTGILADIEQLKLDVAALDGRLDTVEVALAALQAQVNALPVVSVGSYTPTPTLTTNIDAVTFDLARWRRTGSQVSVWGRLNADPTAAGSTVFSISLPIASDLAANFDLSGMAVFNNAVVVGIDGNTSADRARFTFTAPSGAAANMQYQFAYEVK